MGYVLPVNVSVEDKDSGRNGAVSCTIEPSAYFKIEECNQISLKNKVDYEKIKEIQALVFAADNGTPPLSS